MGYWDKVFRARENAMWALIKLFEDSYRDSTTAQVQTDKIIDIINRAPAKPGHVRDYIRAQVDILRTLQDRNHLSFCYEVEGVLYTTKHGKIDVPSYETLADWINVIPNASSGFYWNHSKTKHS